MVTKISLDAERLRLTQGMGPRESWRRWGPFLSERQWATVREDYSADGCAWEYFPHDHARSRAYRWGEDGLLGICDRRCRLCFAIALWNGRDPILKERLFGLTGNEGNHGEDVKECYFYLDATPTASYLKGLYKYPQAAFPYAWLTEENRRRTRCDPEFELTDTGIFDDNRYFDVFVEYAKAAPEDILIRITICNRGPEAATVHLLPTLWFRNTWSWGRDGDDYWSKPELRSNEAGSILAHHESLGDFILRSQPLRGGTYPTALFTENETNYSRLWGVSNSQPYVKDAFHRYVIAGESEAVNREQIGTKAAFWYPLDVPGGSEQIIRLRLTPQSERSSHWFGQSFDRTVNLRQTEADEYYRNIYQWASQFYDRETPSDDISGGEIITNAEGKPLPTEETSRVLRQAFAGLIWSNQFYHFIVNDWLEGDSTNPKPPDSRLTGRNSDWGHLYCRDVMSMPDKWEYPWFAAWDLAFHTIAYNIIDTAYAKRQLELIMNERLMHPNGQIPAYEWAFGDVNPPVHGWAAYRVFKREAITSKPDTAFLERIFQKLLLGFTWWVNRKDPEGKNIFAGGFLGLDNIGAFDRSKPLPAGGRLEQADGTAWMAFFCSNMLNIALELAYHDSAYEDIAYKFVEHVTSIIGAVNKVGGVGLWDEADGFYYDHLVIDGVKIPLKIRSMVGIIPLLSVSVVETRMFGRMPNLFRRIQWFARHRATLRESMQIREAAEGRRALFAIPTQDKLIRVLRYVLDESEFLSPYGIRSTSRYHRDHPFVFHSGGQEYRVNYVPGESDTPLFGGNSNWRGPIWFPINYLLIEALESYYLFYGDELKVECPTGSGRMINLLEVARDLAHRLSRLFMPDDTGRRPCHGDDPRWANDPYWKNLVLFHEYFHGDTGRGLGASHQTGWTALVTRCFRRGTAQFQRYSFIPRAEMPSD
jgi:hypothetical protein